MTTLRDEMNRLITAAFDAARLSVRDIDHDDAAEIITVTVRDRDDNAHTFDFEIGSDDDCLTFTDLNDALPPVIVPLPDASFYE